MSSASGRRRSGPGIRRGETVSGWLFTAPMLIILGLFLVVPVVMALWVSFSDWGGRGSIWPWGSSNVDFVGWKNYAAITSGGGLTERVFGTSLRNTLWYVVLVVPIQTAVALLLAVLVNGKRLRGRGFFRTVFYFPSVTSAVAITVLWLFLFNQSGAVNAGLAWLGIHGPNWFNNPQGIVHALLGVFGITNGPPVLVDHSFLGVSLWNWLSGPSWALSAIMLEVIFTTSGTFMLLFIAALQNLSPEVDEAAMVDGANGWQRFWRVTLPQLRPTLFTVITLGLIACWQVFDQVYTATKGAPANTTMTPAYLSYTTAIPGGQWGQASAMAFIVLVIIVMFTLLQRVILAERTPRELKRIRKHAARADAAAAASAGTSGPGAARVSAHQTSTHEGAQA